MCNRAATPGSDKLKKQLAGYKMPDFPARYHSNGYAHELLPFTANETPDEVHLSMWGLVPGWIKDAPAAMKYANNTLNARSEEIFEKNSYKQYIGKWRGLLWVEGFYEHQSQDPKGKVKHPHFIYMPDHELFTIGCVYSKWLDPVTGQVMDTFSMVTTRGNEMMSEIHNSWKFSNEEDDEPRMPLVILPEERKHWMSELSKNDIIDMMRVLPDGLLQAHRVQKLTGELSTPAVQQPFNDNPGTLF